MDKIDSRAKVWPLHQFGGGDNFEEYDVDKDTWLIDKGYDKFLGKRDPSTVPRVRQSYTVSTDNDPHGARGTRVRYESQADYDSRCKRYSDEDKRLWAKIMRGYCGAARATAMRAPKYKAQALLDLIQQEHGDKSAKQVSHLVRDFISSTKANNKSIKDYNREFDDSVRIMKANGMDLPPAFVLHLYLYSLGLPYRTLEAVVSVLPPAQQTLTHVMKLAVDHTAPENDDEAVNHTALIADMKTEIDNLKKRTTEQAFGAFHSGVPVCANCGKPGHTKDQCFHEGGGLAHLTPQQRHEHLRQKRQRRWQQQQPKDTAAVATEAQVQALTEKVQLRESQLKNATKIVAESGMILDLGFDADKL